MFDSVNEFLARARNDVVSASTEKRYRSSLNAISVNEFIKRNVCDNSNFLFSSRRSQADDANSEREQAQKCFVSQFKLNIIVTLDETRL